MLYCNVHLLGCLISYSGHQEQRVIEKKAKDSDKASHVNFSENTWC